MIGQIARLHPRIGRYVRHQATTGPALITARTLKGAGVLSDKSGLSPILLRRSESWGILSTLFPLWSRERLRIGLFSTTVRREERLPCQI